MPSWPLIVCMGKNVKEKADVRVDEMFKTLFFILHMSLNEEQFLRSVGSNLLPDPTQTHIPYGSFRLHRWNRLLKWAMVIMYHCSHSLIFEVKTNHFWTTTLCVIVKVWYMCYTYIWFLWCHTLKIVNIFYSWNICQQ